MRKLIEKIEFNGLVVEIFDDDYLHACQNHNEVSLGKIRRCIKNPDIVIESYQGKNACLFYEVEMNFLLSLFMLYLQ